MSAINITLMTALLFLLIPAFGLGCGDGSQVTNNEVNRNSDNNHSETNHNNSDEALNCSENHTNPLNNASNSETNSESNSDEIRECELELARDECEERECRFVQVKWIDWDFINGEICPHEAFHPHSFCLPPQSLSENSVSAKYGRLEGNEWKVYSFPNPLIDEHEEFVPCDEEWGDEPKPRECDC